MPGTDLEKVHVTHSNGEILEEDALPAFSEQDEKSYLRKVDFRILPILLFTYTIQYYDKSILGHAVLFGFISDLGLFTVTGAGISTMKYSDVTMIFYAGFAIGAYPMLMLAQRFPPSRSISVLIMIWGIIVLCIPSCRGFGAIMTCRALLGIFESAVGPLMNTYMTYWWSRREQSLRSSIWYSASGLGSMLSPLIDYGLGQINGSIPSWGYMFYFAGSITVIWSVVIWFFLPDSAEEWSGLNESELAANRSRVAQYLESEEKTSIQKFQILESLTSHTTYVASILAFCGGITGVAMVSFMTLIVSSFGLTILQTLCLSIPAGFIYVMGMVISGYINQRFRNKLYMTTICANFIGLVGVLICWVGYNLPQGVLMFGVLLIASQSVTIYASYHIAAANTTGHTKKATVNSIVFLMAALGNIAGSYINSSSPGPRYVGEWAGCTASMSASIVTCVVSWIWLARVNRKRDDKYGSPQITSSKNVTDKENKDFRYIY